MAGGGNDAGWMWLVLVALAILAVWLLGEILVVLGPILFILGIVAIIGSFVFENGQVAVMGVVLLIVGGGAFLLGDTIRDAFETPEGQTALDASKTVLDANAEIASIPVKIVNETANAADLSAG